MKKSTTHSTRWSETNFNFTFIRSLFFMVFLLGIQYSFSQKTWDGGGSNDNWSTAANWNNNTLPASSDNVVIPSGFTALMDISVTVASLNVSGSLTVGSGNQDRTLTVTGNVTVNSGGTITSDGNAGHLFNIGGNLSNAGTFTDNSGDLDVVFNGSAQTISGSGSYLFNDLSFTTSGTKTISSNITVSGDWTNNNASVTGTATVTLDGTASIGGTSNPNFPNLTVTGTITQGRSVTVAGNYIQTSGTYTQNSGATAYSLTVNGNFTMSGSSIFVIQSTSNGAGAMVTVNGSSGVTLSGTASIRMDAGGATASNVSVFQTTNFSSSSTASTSGIIDFGNETNTKNNEFRVSGNFSKTGATGRFFTSATPVNGGFVFNGSGATQTVSIVASSSTEYYNVTVNNGAVVQLTSALTLGTGSNPASSMTVNGTLDTQNLSPAILGGNSGTFTLGAGATLRTGNANGIVSGTTGTISTSVNTRSFNAAANYIFDGAANQTANFGNATINNLTISNTSGSVSLNAAVNVNNITIDTGSSLTGGSFTHLVSGNWTNNGTFVPGTGTINFDLLNQSIGGTTATSNFNNLILSGGGTKDFGKPLAISGNLSIASGVVANLGSLATHTAGTLTLGGIGTAAARFGSTATSATAPVFKNNTFFTSGTTGYITVGSSSCVAPSITFGTIPGVCPGVTSVSLPYTATAGSPNLYTISGTGITSVSNGILAAAPSTITIALSSPAAAGTITPSIFTVSNGTTGCISANINGSVTVNPILGPLNFTAGSLSECQNAADETYTATATGASAISYSVSPPSAGTIGSASGVLNWNSSFTGTATVTATATGCGGPVTATREVTVTPTVGNPSFTAGPTSICQNAPNATYTATATNTTGISYSVAPSSAGTINSVTGEMDWNASFSGDVTITVTVTGCGGPKTATRNVEVTATVGNPSFFLGPTTVCQDDPNDTFGASASDSTGITYSVSPPSAGTITTFFGLGSMNWNSGFSGTATITATATGCNGPKTVDRVVTVTPSVGTPTFTAGALSVCQDAPNETYTATATNASSISYSVTPTAAGTIGSTSGIMNWSASFTGNATITATAEGCNGPTTVNRVVLVTPTVGAPDAISPSSTTICQASANTDYHTSATNVTGYTWSVTGLGNSISGTGSTGTVSWAPGFSGIATVSVVANGCNGPSSSVATTVTVTPSVGTPSFLSGATTLCQDAPNTTYTATASNSTGIAYSLLPLGAGTIGASSGIVDWDSGFSGIATITATAIGCNGTSSADLSVTVTPSVGTPLFLTGPISICQNATDTAYSASASNSTLITYSLSPIEAGSIGAINGIVDWAADFVGTAIVTASASGCNGPSTVDLEVTVNALPVVTASDVTGCAGSSINLIGSGTPVGGSGNFSVAHPYVGSISTTYTYAYTAPNGCSATSSAANITITPQPTWYADVDGDQYGATALAISSCTNPIGYVAIGGDCDDNDPNINPGETEICYNNTDDNCNGLLSEGCIPVVVNMTPSYDGYTLPSLAVGIPAVAYSYPATANIKYRFSVKNETTNSTAPDIIQTSRYVSIPASLHLYGATYTIKASAVINEEIVAYAGNTITITAPTVQLINLSSVSCGATLASLTSTISANAALNATGYTFRIRVNDSNPTPEYHTSQSATRFVGANSFAGFPLKYGKSYKVSVQYTFTDPVTNLPVQSGYGAECTINTPAIPVTSIASPICGSQVAAMNATVTAKAAPYATGYQFRVRLFASIPETATYFITPVTVSRFSSLAAFQGTLAYGTDYLVSVRYSVLNETTTEWSDYGPECKVTTPFFPTTSVLPTQCGQTDVTLNQQLNISPYPGFPQYVVRLEELSMEEEGIVADEEISTFYPHFRLNQFAIAQHGKNYNISIALRINGVLGDFSTACDISTGLAAKTTISRIEPFKATAYPNPFASGFMLDVKSSSPSSVIVKVYDMIGRMIEQKELRMSDIETMPIGTNYPSGVYNVVVAQDESIQTVRVVKR